MSWDLSNNRSMLPHLMLAGRVRQVAWFKSMLRSVKSPPKISFTSLKFREAKFTKADLLTIWHWTSCQWLTVKKALLCWNEQDYAMWCAFHKALFVFALLCGLHHLSQHQPLLCSHSPLSLKSRHKDPTHLTAAHALLAPSCQHG